MTIGQGLLKVKWWEAPFSSFSLCFFPPCVFKWVSHWSRLVINNDYHIAFIWRNNTQGIKINKRGGKTSWVSILISSKSRKTAQLTNSKMPQYEKGRDEVSVRELWEVLLLKPRDKECPSIFNISETCHSSRIQRKNRSQIARHFCRSVETNKKTFYFWKYSL